MSMPVFARISDQVALSANCDELASLRGFIKTMSAEFPLESFRCQCKHIGDIVNACSTPPTDITSTLDTMKKAGTEASALVSFRCLPQGKKLMALAEEFASTKTHLVQFLKGMKDICFEADTCFDSLDGLNQEAACGKLQGLTSGMKKLLAQCDPSKDEGCAAAADDARKKLSHLALHLVSHHLKLDGLPWLQVTQVQTTALKATRTMSKPPAFPVLKMNYLLESSSTQKVSTLSELEKFYDCLGALAVQVDLNFRTVPGSATSQELRSIAVELCSSYTTWLHSKNALLVSNPSAFGVIQAFDEEVKHLITSSCFRTWAEAVDLPIQVVSKLVSTAWRVDSNALPDDMVQKAEDCIPNAQLLATGLEEGNGSESDITKSVKGATDFLSRIVKFSKVVQSDDADSPPSASGVIQLFDLMMSLGLASSSLEKDIKLDKTVLMYLEGLRITMNKTFSFLADQHSQTLVNLQGELQHFKHFPETKEGNEEAFLSHWGTGDSYKKFSSLLDRLESSLSSPKADCEVMKVPVEQLAPSVQQAEAERKQCLLVVTVYAALKILWSQAAKCKSASLRPSVQKLLEFAKAKTVEVPPFVIKGLQQLLGTLQDAAAPSGKKRKSPECGANK
ncbi:unnamed protein product [Durusdinium trenchii]|uniref:Uncharacterized protein n=1 Tax=Durusdinium trenchii TaxID=1381693 RepID=A0ABP0RFX2_9DINO